jgi:hypothetical protein
MAINVRGSLRKEINRFRRAIAQKTSEMASLNGDLRRHERALELLENGTTRLRTKPANNRSRTAVNWSSVLGRLPNSFTLKDVNKRPESRGKSPVYLRQIVSKWAKGGKTKRVSLGKYQKIERKKLRSS